MNLQGAHLPNIPAQLLSLADTSGGGLGLLGFVPFLDAGLLHSLELINCLCLSFCIKG